MKLRISIVAFLSLIVTLKSLAITPPSEVAHVTKVLQPFQILTIYDNVNVILLEGDWPGITIGGRQKDTRTIKIEEHDNQLVIRKKDFASSKRIVFIYLTVNNLRSIEVIGDASVVSSGELHGDLLWVKLAGNGEVNVKSDVSKVLTTSWASGKISISGNYCSSSTFRSDSGQLVTSYNKNCLSAQNLGK